MWDTSPGRSGGKEEGRKGKEMDRDGAVAWLHR